MEPKTACVDELQQEPATVDAHDCAEAESCHIDPLGVIEADEPLVMSDLACVRWLFRELAPAFLDAVGLRDAAAEIRALPRIERHHLDAGRFPRGAVGVLHRASTQLRAARSGRWNVQLREHAYDVPHWDIPPGPNGAAFLARMNAPRPLLHQTIRDIATDLRLATGRSQLGWSAGSVFRTAQELLEIEAGGHITDEHRELLEGVWWSLMLQVATEHAAEHGQRVVLDLGRGVIRVEQTADRA